MTCQFSVRLAASLRTGRILNINVPDLPLDEIKGIRVTRCGSRHPPIRLFPSRIPAAIPCTGSARREIKCDAGQTPTLLRWMRVTFPLRRCT